LSILYRKHKEKVEAIIERFDTMQKIDFLGWGIAHDLSNLIEQILKSTNYLRSNTPADNKQKILQPYYFRSKDRQGAGLGLFYVKYVVELHGGFITVDSVPGSGTAFYLYFPTQD